MELLRGSGRTKRPEPLLVLVGLFLIWGRFQLTVLLEDAMIMHIRMSMATAALASTILVAPLATVAQTVRTATAPGDGQYSGAVNFSRAQILAMMTERNIPGLSVAVSINGSVVWSEGFGYANLEQRTPVTTITKFRVGSVSKPYTAAALGLLYEQGRLDLDAPLQQYVPSFPEKSKGVVSTRSLGGHLAGIRHYRNQESSTLSRRYATVLEGLEIFASDTLQTVPGTNFSYSSYGWNLLSAVIEGASGEQFLAYMQANVFGQLAMRHTVAGHTDSIIVGRTGFYERSAEGAIVNAPYVDNSYKWAGGGFLSTPEDMVRFANGHLDSGFLSPETVELLWTSQRTTDGEETGYGIGWFTGDLNGQRTISHGGGSVGGNCLLLILPELNLVLAMTTNISNAGFRDLPQQIALRFAGN
jgi:serine beta-lactamase-like protein LACTB, mitochondrial